MIQARQSDNKYISRCCRQKRNRLRGRPADSPPTLADALRIRVQHLLVIHNRQWTIEIFCNTCMSPWPIHHVPHHVHQKDLSWLYDISYRTRLICNYDKLIHTRISFLMLAVTPASGIQFKRWQTNTCLYFISYIWSSASPVNDKTWNLVKSRSREIEFKKTFVDLKLDWLLYSTAAKAHIEFQSGRLTLNSHLAASRLGGKRSLTVLRTSLNSWVAHRTTHGGKLGRPN